MLFALLLAGALAGCGGSGSNGPTTVSRTSSSATSAGATRRTTTVASATTSTREVSSVTHARTTTTRPSTTRRASTSTSTSTSTSASTSARTSTRVARTRSRPASPLDLAAAIAVCQREVSSAPLTTAESSQLSRLCVTAATLGRRQLGAAERRICLTVIEDSAPGLSGPAIIAARQSCARY
jgi:hypothetical protein